MRAVDLPPIWLAAFLGIVWVSPVVEFASGPLRAAGLLCLAFAFVLVVAAVFEFARARTSVIPHQEPTALITTGIFRFSRNPIYLADVLILAGLSLVWGKLLGLILVPALVTLLHRRFIEPEEARLRKAFGEDFEVYEQATRRWL